MDNFKEILRQALIEQSPPIPRPRPGIPRGVRGAGFWSEFLGLPANITRKPRFRGQRGNKPHNVDPFSKADALLSQLLQRADSVYNNLGQLFSDFFEMLGDGYAGAFDAFRMMLRNMIADPDPTQLNNAASAMIDYLFDAELVISISEDGTQMFFTHNGATAAQNEVIDVFFNGAIGSVDGLLEALIDAFPDSLYGS